ncbi:16S rRNA (guanine(966)-N(2))-methyltransferase RsmD [Tepidiforma sp.]|jgi:16S rRNA (guanine966-N2)-methyltransferase|uniref:16S rRNA (guanine(966)-N(2))-methyltransferase RsmD n=1 Tax=Tepidiforma sp. TaxID=2682230 RepID=UPI0021DE70D8|nr:16S rRNA (guanine(966)-N(2))-methyltransferase RsmD [Tepidiforma sp.]MCX7617384.1 16S rRNA (guanine(966)-N(2))-methyltransferase RsmD [Tepidiforma sp.]GIW17393.1 MAG: methyltransferase small [Tepidiforma sp.]
MAGRGVRVAGGVARGVPLVEPRGVRLRPTSGLVREAIFNILGRAVEDARVLDLYAGTGALGIEALSRGAAHATFVEGEAACTEAILQSLARTGLGERATVLRGRIPAALTRLEGPFDLIFMDPPYDDPAKEEVLAGLAPLLAPGGRVVFEHGSRYNPPVRPRGLQLLERRTYGDTAVALYSHLEGE